MSDPLTGRLKDAVRAIAALRTKVDRLEAERNAPIAVVGMACRVPDAGDVASFWQNLVDGRDSVRPVPPDRWDAASWYDPDPDAPGRIAFRQAAFLDDVDGFDADLFGIAAREAESMDPQQRLLLEVAWHALEDAGIAPDRLQRQPVGVFLGLNGTDHLLGAMAAPERIDTHMLSGAVASVAAGRLAFVLGLTGPALVVDTACSSSLVATHLAVASLRRGECNVALAGGAHLLLEPHVPVALSRARMLAPDGRCKPFDARADGFGQGEGCGVVVLKRLADALQAGDRVRAVIRGSALNHDGRAAGLTAPSGRAQEAVIRAALANAGLTPADVDAIEAHGTGTSLGDPIELHALASLFRDRDQDRPLWVGSLKSNIGHLAAGAGIMGLIKAVLMAKRGEVPPSLHFERLNPHIELGGADIRVPVNQVAVPLRAIGVSSFGFSGTNAHLVVTPPPGESGSAAMPPLGGAPRLLISARTPAVLKELIERYRAHLVAHPDTFADVCHSAATGRARLPWWVCVERPQDLATAEPQHGPHPELGPQPGRQVALPLYPFDRQRFAARRSLRPPPSSPLPGRLLDLPSPGRQLVTDLDLAELPWLADHQVGGRIVVPGALILVVMAAAAPPGRSSLAEVRFLEPIVLGPDQPVRLVTTVSAADEITVSSRSGGTWVAHARAIATARMAEPVAMRPAAGAHIDRPAWRSRLAERGIAIGPAFQAIRGMEQADGRAVAELDRPPEIRFERLPLHPALLDAALQVAGGTLVGEAMLLPVGIDAVSFLGADPGIGALRAVATRRSGADEPAIDIVLEGDGRPLALIEGMRVREVAAAVARGWLATIVWEPMPTTWLPPLAEPPT
ncbi:MAG: beta-ketoacyl synthase N-terminal-like domain-containing protein, partial [Geminicoccaceae bacterium]